MEAVKIFLKVWQGITRAEVLNEVIIEKKYVGVFFK